MSTSSSGGSERSNNRFCELRSGFSSVHEVISCCRRLRDRYSLRSTMELTEMLRAK